MKCISPSVLFPKHQNNEPHNYYFILSIYRGGLDLGQSAEWSGHDRERAWDKDLEQTLKG